MKQFTDANFATEVIGNTEPTLVDFWSTGCGQPCSDTESMLNDLEPTYPNDTFGMLLTDTNPITTAQYAITVYPTVLIFNNGVVVNRFDGAPTQMQIIDALNALEPRRKQAAGETAEK